MRHFLKLLQKSVIKSSQPYHLSSRPLAGLFNLKENVDVNYNIVQAKKYISYSRDQAENKSLFSEKSLKEEELEESDVENEEVSYEEDVNESKLKKLSRDEVHEDQNEDILNELNEDEAYEEENADGLNLKELSENEVDEGMMIKELNHHELNDDQEEVNDARLAVSSKEKLGLVDANDASLNMSNSDELKDLENLDNALLKASAQDELYREEAQNVSDSDELDQEKVQDFELYDEALKHESFITRDEIKTALLDVYGKANDAMLDKIMTVKSTPLDELSLHQFETQIEKVLMVDQIFQEKFPKIAFFNFDKNLDGKLNREEINMVLHQIGEDVDKKKLKTLMKNYDKDEDGFLDYDEFCEFTKKELYPRYAN